MKSLELKIPPPIIVAMLAIAMWGISKVTPLILISTSYHVYIAIALALLGGIFTIAGVISFRQAQTTINPTKPELTSSLVSAGIYKVTRNPMYLGLLFLLTAWAAFLASPGALIGPLAFFFYIDRFQIAPEEIVLLGIFGNEYSVYQTRVHRWL
jgi:protein-S-isoprenylcysteine O-methyltransferase Ste14